MQSTFYPPWPGLGPHDVLYKLSMAWLFPLLLLPLSMALLCTEAISLPLQGAAHMILLWGNLIHPRPQTASPSCFHGTGLHLYFKYFPQCNVYCSSSVYSYYVPLSQWRLGTVSNTVHNITLSNVLTTEVRKYLLSRRLLCCPQTHFSPFPCSAPYCKEANL